jgi:stage IV sporulation protein FB
MPLFQPPSATRYDLRFTLLGIPVRVHPLFWIMALIFGAVSGDILQLLIWVAVVFVSILIHEMGHALTMRYYGQAAEVILYLGGGLAVARPDGLRRRWTTVDLTPGQHILISLAGPGAGFLLAALVMVVVVVLGGTVFYTPLFGVIPFVTAYLPNSSGLVYSVVAALLWVNIFWGVINLVPVQPLDGGNVARQFLISADPSDGERKALWISVIAGAIATAVGIILMRSTYMALLFGFLAFQSYERVKGGSRRYY